MPEKEKAASSSKTPPKILVIDDDESITSSLEAILPEEGYAVEVAADGRTGLEMAKAGNYDAILSDLRMPGINGLDLIHTLHAFKAKLPVILITAQGTTETAIRATQLGAFDYLLKPYEIPDLLAVLERAVTSYRMASIPVKLGDEKASASEESIIGSSKAMQSVYKDIGRFANKPVTVLIQGETGTGKELVARALYQYSDRSEKPFIAVNCAAIPETLLESELFGHEKGAFTGADIKRIGRFEQANGGTLFLDEIGDLQPGTQVKLLRVLQEKTIQRVGSKHTIPIDVRVIVATHVDLEAAIEEKRFREDLYYRLNGVVVQLPALRDREEDISQLTSFFIGRYTHEFSLKKTSIRKEALKFLESQSWPGNVRQLENVIRKALLQAEGYAITQDILERILEKKPRKPQNGSASSSPDSKGLDAIVRSLLDEVKEGRKANALEPLTEMLEESLYRQAIEIAGGNQAKAARWVGVSRLTMREKLQKFGFHPAK